jgi:serine/threonine protein kinase
MSYRFVARHVMMRGSNMALQAGMRLGPYEVLSLIGTGGMGEVYRARDTRLERSVAVKVLAPELATDPESSHNGSQVRADCSVSLRRRRVSSTTPKRKATRLAAFHR